MLKKYLPVVCLAGIILTTLNAQAVNPAVTVPRTVRYTGSLHAASGGALQPVESVTLAIYSDQTGGDPLWQETQNVQPDAAGSFAVEIGATQNDGLPLDLLRTAEPRWLAVRLNQAGEAEQPRVRLLSVPYALRAVDAETLGGKPASAYLLAAGVDTFSSSTATNASVTATGSSNAATTLKPRATSGSAGFLGRFVNGTDLGNSVVFDTGSRVGIGSTLPYDLLHVRFSDTSGGLTGLAVQNMGSGAASYSGTLFYDQNGALGQFQGFNNSTHEYRINNIASNGSINFMLASTSKFQVRSDGDIDIAGSIRKGGSLFLHTPGVANTAVGMSALNSTTGNNNTAIGNSALFRNGTGSDNTAVGAGTLTNNQNGTSNTACGSGALSNNISGIHNTASGAAALQGSVTGNNNTASGSLALTSNSNGGFNTANGFTALYSNITGFYNTADGENALFSNTTGSNNTAVGSQAGYNITTGSNNIMIGNFGVAGDDSIIRVGQSGTQTGTFIAGIRGTTTGHADAVAVVIDSNGQLGTINSSRRFKEDIQNMGESSSNLLRLRPVTYHYKQPYTDGSTPRDYGLIAEEVAEVYPDLVVRDKDGHVETVQYHKLTPMLLNELQKQNQRAQQQDEKIRRQNEQIQMLGARLAVLEALLSGKVAGTNTAGQ